MDVDMRERPESMLPDIPRPYEESSGKVANPLDLLN